MPNMDGFELTEAIRAAQGTRTHLPIIAITANAMQGEAERCRERGMDDYLSKPLRLTELGPMLVKWMPHAITPWLNAEQLPASPDQPGLEAEGPGAVQDDALPVWNPDTLTELVGDNPAMHRRLLEKFLLNAELQVTQITATAASSDTTTLAGVAHTLKSAARSVGALALGEVCQKLESAGNAADAAACSALALALSNEFPSLARRIRNAVDATELAANPLTRSHGEPT
jgi:CheY-like chemotaxis protein